MARRPAQNSRPSPSRSSPKGATTKARPRRSDSSQGGGLGGIPGWLWAIAGLIAGFALSQYLDRSSPEPVAAVVPRPTSSQTTSGSDGQQSGGGANAGASSTQQSAPATPTFEFYTLLPETEVRVIERCSGHGGSWGIMKENFDVALKIGRPVARDAAKDSPGFVVSECPLARDHILQGIERLGQPVDGITPAQHPVELMARAYGL